MMKFRKTWFGIWARTPFGYLLKFRDGNNQIVITKDLWVIMGDGKSKDALPLNFCSQEFVDDIERRLSVKYGIAA